MRGDPVSDHHPSAGQVFWLVRRSSVYEKERGFAPLWPPMGNHFRYSPARPSEALILDLKLSPAF